MARASILRSERAAEEGIFHKSKEKALVENALAIQGDAALFAKQFGPAVAFCGDIPDSIRSMFGIELASTDMRACTRPANAPQARAVHQHNTYH